MQNIGPLIAFVTSHRWARKYRVHKLMRDELCAPYDNDMMMITKNDGSSLLHQCHIVSLHKKAKQSFILSRPFLLSLFAFPLFISVKISSSIGFHNQFEFICFVVDLWIQCWMLNKKELLAAADILLFIFILFKLPYSFNNGKRLS